ncbi:MAG: RNA polymerase sigma factor RpoD/SigA [Planctomycetia bacterium]|nr:RNA polymerase sigma factor RpoD/SigA [Planctomycetia bacterium]
MKRKNRRSSKKDSEMQSLLDLYLEDINNVPLLSLEEELALSRLIEEGDQEARDLMIRANLRLVVSLAKNYIGRGLPLQDIIEEGNLGLIRAVEGYNAKAGTRFSTYATYWVTQTIRRALINKARVIRVPAYMVEIISRWRRATNILTDELNRPPFPEEIGRRIGIEPQRLPIILNAIGIHNMTPAMDPADNPGLEGMVVDEKMRTPDDTLEEMEAIKKIQVLLTQLPERESLILRMRYGMEGFKTHTLRDVGNKLNITRERVRQLERSAIEKLAFAFNSVLHNTSVSTFPHSETDEVEAEDVSPDVYLPDTDDLSEKFSADYDHFNYPDFSENFLESDDFRDSWEIE